MNIYVILTFVILIVSTTLLVFFTSLNKLKKYKDKMDKAENIIDEQLNKKLELIIKINSEVKKVTGKKDYLKDYISTDFIITNIEKDIKLDEANKLIKDLMLDFNELGKDKNFIKDMADLKGINEILVSAKNMFNQNAIESNKIIKVFPNNLVAKLAKIKIRSFYNYKNEIEEF